MIARYEIYRCEKCGNVVEVVEAHAGVLTCCDAPMALQLASVTEAATEKHIPVIEKVETGYLVKVGAVPHPMTEAHYIAFIELTVDGTIYTKDLAHTDAPEYLFCVPHGKEVSAREWCNLHRLWKS